MGRILTVMSTSYDDSLAALKDLVRRHLIANVEAMNSDGPKGALVKDFLHLDG